jgi:hypothetical protein
MFRLPRIGFGAVFEQVESTRAKDWRRKGRREVFALRRELRGIRRESRTVAYQVPRAHWNLPHSAGPLLSVDYLHE